jgi:CHAT domain-containing protein
MCESLARDTSNSDMLFMIDLCEATDYHRSRFTAMHPKQHLMQVFAFLLIGVAVSCSTVNRNQSPGVSKRETRDLEEERRFAAMVRASYRTQKKYHQLEGFLKKEQQTFREKNDPYSELYSTFQLAELYRSDLINIRQALAEYDRADGLNEMLSKQTVRDRVKSPDYFEYVSGQIGTISYKPEWYRARIHRARNSINRWLGNEATNSEHQISYNIQVERKPGDVARVHVDGRLPIPAEFTAFERDLAEKVREFISPKPGSSEGEWKEQFFSYLMAFALCESFDLSRLTDSNVQQILRYAEAAKLPDDQGSRKGQPIKAQFVEAVCRARLADYDGAIASLVRIEHDLRKFEKSRADAIRQVRSAVRKEVLKSTLRAGLDLAVLAGAAILSIQDTAIRPDISKYEPNGIRTLVDDFEISARISRLIGESEQGRLLNIFFNADQELTLCAAAGRSHLANKNFEAASRYYRQAVSIINSQRSSINSEQHRINLTASKHYIYSQLVDTLFAEGRPEEALTISENVRSRSLVDIIGSARTLRLRAADEQEIADAIRELQLNCDLMRENTDLSEEQAAHYNRMRATLAAYPAASRESTRAQKTNKEAVGDLLSVVPISVSEIQRRLPSGTALIEFFISEQKVYAWLVERTRVKAFELPTSPAYLQEQVFSFNNLIQESDSSKLDALARQLFGLLLDDVLSFTKSRSLIIVPHRCLHSFPFDALRNDQGYLVSLYDISYLPSASVLRFQPTVRKPYARVLALGSDHPDIDRVQHLEAEAREVAACFPNSHFALGAEATESLVRNTSSEYDVIHFASHATFDPAQPMNSHLLLRADDQNDGVLTAGELYGLNMNDALVTLSACKTASTSIDRGDEILGLTRGLFFAGASSIIATSWEVEDGSTRELMKTFYRELSQGKVGPCKALARAKRILITQHGLAPFYWAAFSLYGYRGE